MTPWEQGYMAGLRGEFNRCRNDTVYQRGFIAGSEVRRYARQALRDDPPEHVPRLRWDHAGTAALFALQHIAAVTRYRPSGRGPTRPV